MAQVEHGSLEYSHVFLALIVLCFPLIHLKRLWGLLSSGSGSGTVREILFIYVFEGCFGQLFIRLEVFLITAYLYYLLYSTD
jgi:hypothetical protein